MAGSDKLSISLPQTDARWAKAKAKRLRTSVSAVITEAIRLERQAEARVSLLEDLGSDDIRAEDLGALRAEIEGRPTKKRRARRNP